MYRRVSLPSDTNIGALCFLTVNWEPDHSQAEDIKLKADMNNVILTVKFPRSQPEKLVKNKDILKIS